MEQPAAAADEERQLVMHGSKPWAEAAPRTAARERERRASFIARRWTVDGGRITREAQEDEGGAGRDEGSCENEHERADVDRGQGHPASSAEPELYTGGRQASGRCSMGGRAHAHGQHQTQMGNRRRSQSPEKESRAADHRGACGII